MLRTITVQACLEVAKLADEDTTIDFSFVTLKAVVDAGCAAGLASLACGIADFGIVPIPTVSMLSGDTQYQVSPDHSVLSREPLEFSPVDLGIAE